MSVRLICGDCLEVLRGLDAASVEAIVTDPPAGIAFMGKAWDRDKGGREQWVAWMAEIAAECLRVAKPGAHALVWALPRTSHWTATAWENAGWEVRDRVAHIFGSGFPKSADVSKALDKAAGAEREVVGQVTKGSSPLPGNHSGTWADGQRDGTFNLTAPATPLALAWQGWGTALKPAVEDWWLLRKPLDGTVAANVERWGCGGINVDGCRVGTETVKTVGPAGGGRKFARKYDHNGRNLPNATLSEHAGRWPANLVLDEAAGAMLDQQSGESKSRPDHRDEDSSTGETGIYRTGWKRKPNGCNDSGGASRFFQRCDYGAADRIVLDSLKLVAYNQANDSVGSEEAQLWENTDRQANIRADSDTPRARGTTDSAFGTRTPSPQEPCSPTTGYGSKPTGLSQTAIPSTTSTETSRITDSKTCGSLTPQPISDSIADASCETVSGISGVPSAESISQLPKNTGTSPMKDTPCMGDADPAISPESLMTSASESSGDAPTPTDRFRYVPKASRRERNLGLPPGERSHHPTVKPLALMRWLVRLVTPPGGTVLDPFLGSGTTAVACVQEGVGCIGIEMEAEYLEIARRRVEHAETQAADQTGRTLALPLVTA